MIHSLILAVLIALTSSAVVSVLSWFDTKETFKRVKEELWSHSL